MTEHREPHIHTPEHDRPRHAEPAPYDEVTALRKKLDEVITQRNEARETALRMKARNEELEAKLAAKSGMGIQENQPDAYSLLRDG